MIFQWILTNVTMHNLFSLKYRFNCPYIYSMIETSTMKINNLIVMKKRVEIFSMIQGLILFRDRRKEK